MRIQAYVLLYVKLAFVYLTRTSNHQQMPWADACTHARTHKQTNTLSFPLLQNLPALVKKIMQASVKPIDKQYSEVSPTYFFHITLAAGCICFPQGLRELQKNMLHLIPDQRPSIEDIMAEPLIINALINLYTDIGRLPCSNRYLFFVVCTCSI